MFAKKQPKLQKPTAKVASSTQAVRSGAIPQNEKARTALEHPSLDILKPQVVLQLQSIYGNAFVNRLLQRARADGAQGVSVHQRVTSPVLQLSRGKEIRGRLDEILGDIELQSPRNRTTEMADRLQELKKEADPLVKDLKEIQRDANNREFKRLKEEKKGEKLSEEETLQWQNADIPKDLQKNYKAIQKQLKPLKKQQDILEAQISVFNPFEDPSELLALVDEVKELKKEAGTLGKSDLVEQSDFILRRAVQFSLQGAVTNEAVEAPPSIGSVAEEFGVPIDMPKPIKNPNKFKVPKFKAISAAIETSIPNSEGAATHAQTADKTEKNKNVAAQVAVLLSKVHEAYLHYRLQQAMYGAGLLGVFLGPEWFFGRVKVYSAEQKEQVIAELVKASLRYPNMLIVPGTILWTPDGTNVVNSAPVIINGKLQRLLAKKNLGGDTRDGSKFVDKDHPERAEVVDEEDESGLFNVGNVSFALDICADHSKAEAKQEYYAQQEPGPGVQVHLITAAGRAPDQQNLVTAPGGVVLGSDADTQAGYVGGMDIDAESEQPSRGRLAASEYKNRSKELIDMGEPATKGLDRGLGRFGLTPTPLKLPKADGNDTIPMDELREKYGNLVGDLKGSKQLQALIAIHEASGGEDVEPMSMNDLKGNYWKLGTLPPKTELEVLLAIDRYVANHEDKKGRAKSISGMIAALKRVKGANLFLAQSILAKLEPVETSSLKFPPRPFRRTQPPPPNK